METEFVKYLDIFEYIKRFFRAKIINYFQIKVLCLKCTLLTIHVIILHRIFNMRRCLKIVPLMHHIIKAL